MSRIFISILFESFGDSIPMSLFRGFVSFPLLLSLLHPALAQETNLQDADHYELTAQWDDPGEPTDATKGPLSQSNLLHCAVAVDASGNAYVSNRSTNGIKKFSPEGKILASWKLSKDNCECNSVYVITVGPQGHLYVVDSCCHRILEYDPEGNLVNTIGGPGQSKLANYTAGIAVEPSGNLFITGGDKVTEISPAGQVLQSFGKEGSWPGEFKNPGKLALDGAGNLYVGDGWNKRIQVFNPQGKFIREVGNSGPAADRILFPGNFTVGAKGDLWVFDKGIKWYDPQGRFVKELEIRGMPSMEGSPFGGTAMDAQGNFYLVHENVPRILKFSPVLEKMTAGPTPTVVMPPGKTQWPIALKVPNGEIPKIEEPAGLALSPRGTILVLDKGIEIKANGSSYFRSRLVKFGPDLKPQLDWGTSMGSPNSETLNCPQGVCVDGQDKVYVADTQNHRVVELDPEESLLAAWGPDGKQQGSGWLPVGVVTDLKGHVFVSDITDNEVRKFDDSGRLLLKWGGKGQARGKFNQPYGLACDASGNLYVADTGNNRIQKFSGSGKFLKAWGGKGVEKGQFLGPRAVALGPYGKVWVADTENHRLQAFSVAGQWLAAQTLTGDPVGLDLDGKGRVFWVDGANNQLKILDPQGGETPFGIDMEIGRIDRIEGLRVLPNGNFLMTEGGRVFLYTPEGKWLSTWKSENPKDVPHENGVSYWGNLFVRPSGELWFLQSRYDRLNILKYDREGKELGKVEGEEFDKPQGGGIRFVVAGWEPEFQAYLAAFDSGGNIYVADAGHYRVMKFNPQCRLVKIWGSQGTEDGNFQWLTGIAIDSKNRIYTLEDGTGRVQIFDTEGHLQGHWQAKPAKPRPSVNYGYRMLTQDPFGNLWIQVSGNDGMVELDGFTSSGSFLKALDWSYAYGSSSWGRDGSLYFVPSYPTDEILEIPVSEIRGEKK
jgi:tripartite motif-containing protein 71